MIVTHKKRMVVGARVAWQSRHPSSATLGDQHCWNNNARIYNVAKQIANR